LFLREHSRCLLHLGKEHTLVSVYLSLLASWCWTRAAGVVNVLDFGNLAKFDFGIVSISCSLQFFSTFWDEPSFSIQLLVKFGRHSVLCWSGVLLSIIVFFWRSCFW
jgi:hypothetical protein